MTDDPMIVTVVTRRDMDAPEIVPLAGCSVALFSSRNPVKERDNEDGAALIGFGSGRAVLAVADGVGGQRSGADAAERALNSLVRCVEQRGVGEAALRTAVLDGFDQANASVQELGTGAATTLIVAEIEGGTVRPYHVGDSTILVTGQRGRVKLLTVAHSPVGYAVEAGLLDEKEAIHHADRHLVSNIVGTEDMRIEVGRTLTLRPRDTVVLGSDGLFDNLHVSEIVEAVRKGPVREGAQRLVEVCRRRMAASASGHPSKPDDLTFLIYRGGRAT